MNTQDFRMNGDERIGAGNGKRPRGLRRVLVLFVLLAFVFIVWYAFKEGQQAGINQITPVIRADSEPFKVKPDEPGGMEIPHQDKLVYEQIQGKNSPSTPEKLLPLPEQPMQKKDSESAATTPPQKSDGSTESLTLLPAKEVQELPKAEIKRADNETLKPAARSSAPKAEVVKPIVEPKAKPPKPAVATARPREPIPSERTGMVDLSKVLEAEPQATEPKPMPEPVADQAKQEPTSPAQEDKPSKDLTQNPEPVAAKDGKFIIQLASLPDAEKAKKTLPVLENKFRAILNGARLRVVAAEIPGKGTFHRIQAVGFADKADAQAACAKLVSQGQACILAGKTP